MQSRHKQSTRYLINLGLGDSLSGKALGGREGDVTTGLRRPRCQAILQRQEKLLSAASPLLTYLTLKREQAIQEGDAERPAFCQLEVWSR